MTTPTAMPLANAPAASDKGKYLALTAMMFAVAMTFIDQTIVAIAAPSIEKELGLTQDDLQWVVNGYLLGLGAVFAFFGRVSDIVGHRKMVIIGVLLFVTASVMCGITPAGQYAAEWMISFRVVQGVAAAIMFPAALAIVVGAFEVRERGRALAIFFAVSGGLTAIGPITGGYLITEWSWRAIFLINVPVAIIALILTFMCKDKTVPSRERLDWLGAILIAAGMTLSVLGLQQAGNWGWTDVKTIGCILLGVALLAIFVYVETRVATPLIKVRIFKDRAFFADNFVLFFAMMAFVPVFFFVSVYAQVSLGQSASDAGEFLMWFFLGFAVASQIGGAQLDKRGAKQVVALGCLVAAAGFALWGWKATNITDSSGQVPFIIMAGAGIGLLLGPASTDAVNRAFGASYGEVTGISQTLRNFGSALGLAVFGTVLGSVFHSKAVSSLGTIGFDPQQADTFVNSLTRGAGPLTGHMPPEVVQRAFGLVQADYADAIQVVFYGMAGALIIAFLVSLLHTGTRVVAPGELLTAQGDVEPEVTPAGSAAGPAAEVSAPATQAQPPGVAVAAPERSEYQAPRLTSEKQAPDTDWQQLVKFLVWAVIIFALIYFL